MKPSAWVDGLASKGAGRFSRAPFLSREDLEDERHASCLLLQHPLQEIDFVAQRRVVRRQGLNLPNGMQHGRVVTAAEAPADFRAASA